MKFDIEKTDINILLSIINMKLRDEFRDLDDLVHYYDINKDKLLKKMDQENYKYAEENNQFIQKNN